MTHHPGIHHAGDLFAKLARELANLEHEVSADTFANLVVTAYSLCDWISNDPAVPQSARDALPMIRTTPALLACRDLANGTKHFVLNYPNAVVVDATCVTGFGMGAYGRGPYGIGEPTIQVTLANSTLVDGVQLARDVTGAWQAFLTKNGIVSA